jgi:hypothetical protein
MTPILVVDNSNRVLCRGHFTQEGPRIEAHLRFMDLAGGDEPTQAATRATTAARTVAEINSQVRARLEAVDRRRRRQEIRRAILGAVKACAIWLALMAGAWILLGLLIWALFRLLSFF